ncbi:MAG: hypothetical protein KDA92_09915 [Planctomycetales bacterium]|nr:hypothetical protein [Planctomycetales bacterium]
MNRPPEPPKPVRSFVPIFLAAMVLTSGVGVLSFLTLGFFGVIIAVGLALALVIAFQYVVWGRWLMQYLQRQEQQRDKEQRDQARQ